MKLNFIHMLLFVFFVCSLHAYEVPLTVQSYSRKIYLKPRRRILLDFKDGREAKVKIIFEKTLNERNNLAIRWFYGDKSTDYLNKAEEPHKLDIKGNPGFRLESVRSGNVLMFTLTIKAFEANFPICITTLFSYPSSLYQYVLETKIANPIDRQDDKLASLIWLSVPHNTVTINRLGKSDITVKCMVQIEAPTPVTIGEVRIYKSELKENKEPRGSKDQLKTIGLTKTTVDRDNETNATTGKYTYDSWSFSDFRKGFNNTSSVLYQLMTSIQISNASEEDTGVYTCVSELVNAKICSSSWVKDTEKTLPVVLFESCEDNSQVKTKRSMNPRGINQYRSQSFNNRQGNYRRDQDHERGNFERPWFVVILRPNRPSCVKCSVFGSLMDYLKLHKDGVEVKEFSNTTILDRHINVSDGAMSELTLTFLNPSYEDTGHYRCSVHPDIKDNSVEEDHVIFEIKMIDK